MTAPDPAAPGHAEPLRGVDLRCEPGEVVGILGPNGSGKSTLLRLLATVRAPAGGTLRLLGRNTVPPTAALRRRIGYAADVPVHLDALTGRENALFFARAAGLDRRAADAATAELLRRLDLAPDAGRPVAEYSHGMRRKLLLVEALAHSPDLIVLDEPTLGLDLSALDSLRALVAERAGAGAAIVLATHDVAQAHLCCDRVVFLHHGRVALEGRPAELLHRAGLGTLIEASIAADRPPALALAGAETVHAAADRVVLRSNAGTATLPALCAALLDAGARIHAIRVREPDLGDVFRQLTGHELDAEPRP